MDTPCSFCRRASASVECGGGCSQQRVYCNQECANKDWSAHKELCLVGVNGNDERDDDWLSVKEQRRLELSSLTKLQLEELAKSEGIEIRNRGKKVEWLKTLPLKAEIVNRILIAFEERGQLEEVHVSPVKLITGPYRDIISSIVRNGEVSTLLTFLTASSELKRIEDANPLLFWKEAFHLYFPEYAVTFVPDFVKTLHRRGENTYRKLCLLFNWAHRRVLKRYENTTDFYNSVRLIRTDDGFSEITRVKFLGKSMLTKHFCMLNGFAHGQLLAYYGDIRENLSFDEMLEQQQNDMKRSHWHRFIPMRPEQRDERFIGNATNMNTRNFLNLVSLCSIAETWRGPGSNTDAQNFLWTSLPESGPLIKDSTTGKEMISIGEELH